MSILDDEALPVREDDSEEPALLAHRGALWRSLWAAFEMWCTPMPATVPPPRRMRGALQAVLRQTTERLRSFVHGHLPFASAMQRREAVSAQDLCHLRVSTSQTRDEV
jgi:hypothetical protein